MVNAIERCLALSRRARSQQGEALAQTLSELDAALNLARSSIKPADMPAVVDPGATFALDLTGYVTAWSDGAQEMFGYAASEVIGQHVLFLYAEDDDDARRQLRADPELVAEEHDERSDDDVRQERDHEDLVVEDPVEKRAQAAEDGVERCDDGDWCEKTFHSDQLNRS